jgi:hypothetical protein
MLKIAFLGICLMAVLVTSCPSSDEDDTPEPVDERATVRFYNESSYQIDIYKNLNPAFFDPTTLVCTINSGATLPVKMYASADQLIGDTFFPRYKVSFGDGMDYGRNIVVDAKRDLSNVTFVVEKGKSYTKTIPQPSKGELQAVNGYLRIQNKGNLQIQIIRGDEILSRLDNGAVYLSPKTFGLYEIQFSPFDDPLIMSQLKAFSTVTVNFPTFSMERGKWVTYNFDVDGNTISGPDIEQFGVN